MINARFPLYALRAYDSIEDYEQYKIIRTSYNTYIIDSKEISGDYARRRLVLRSQELPMKLYPLRERFSTISQMVNSKRRDFIDSDGKIFKYKPTKYYHIKYIKVFSASRTWNGYYLLMTKLPIPFVTEEPSAYVGYIQVGASYYLYELSDELKPTSRKKI